MSQQQTIGRHCTSIFNMDGYTCVKYHDTVVVSFDNDRIVLNSGGWFTPTTKTRMNQSSHQFLLDFHVYQKDFEWFVDDFEDLLGCGGDRMNIIGLLNDHGKFVTTKAINRVLTADHRLDPLGNSA